MVGRAKRPDARVSTATNGCSWENITRLVAGGMDQLAFSLAGIGAETTRCAGEQSSETILRAIDEVAAVKKELRTDSPAVNVAYLLLRSDLSSLQEIVPALEGRGIENLIVSLLDFVPERPRERTDHSKKKKQNLGK